MRLLFLGCVALGVLLLFGRRRRFDFFSVGFLSTCLYYLSCFTGQVSDVNLNDLAGLSLRAVDPRVYLIVSCLLLAIAIAAWLHDRSPWRVTLPRLEESDAALDTAAIWATAIGIAGFLGTVQSVGTLLLDPDKSNIAPALGRFYVLWRLGAVVGFLLGLTTRRRACVVVAGLLVLADVYVGYRSSAALCVIGAFVVALRKHGPRRILSTESWRPVLLGLAVVSFFFVYKGFYIALKYGDWNLIRERLSDAGYYVEVIVYGSEPFLVAGTLNEVVRTGFEIDPSHYLEVAYTLLPFSPELGAEITPFNSMFQPALFPDREAGLASNFLAEAWSAGGAVGVAGVCGLYIAGLWLGSRMLDSGRLWSILALVAFPAWAFYLHRNDLQYQLVMERSYVVVCLAALFVSVLVAATVPGRSGRSSPSVTGETVPS